MGLIPLSVMWIYITWLIVLFGLQLAYTTQHLKTLSVAEAAAMKQNENCFLMNDLTVASMLAKIHQTFEDNQGPISAEKICGQLNMPGEFSTKILGHLVDEKLLLMTTEPNAGYVLAREASNITLAEIAVAADTASFTPNNESMTPRLKQIIESQRQKLSEITLADAASKSDDKA